MLALIEEDKQWSFPGIDDLRQPEDTKIVPIQTAEYLGWDCSRLLCKNACSWMARIPTLETSYKHSNTLTKTCSAPSGRIYKLHWITNDSSPCFMDSFELFIGRLIEL
jgi:hypothetical protein